MPFLARRRDPIALGGRQAQRLQQLRIASEKHVHEEHLVSSPAPARVRDALSPVYGHSSRASRTVEAVIESRSRQDDDASRATKIRRQIRDARGGIQTERGAEEVRPATTISTGQDTSRLESMDGAMRPRPATHAAGTGRSILRQRIVAVRRRRVGDLAPPRKLTREELEWIEKQLQFTQRVSLLEKECTSWWRTFYSSASGNADSSSDVWATAQAIQRQTEDGDKRRYQDAQALQQQLNALRKQGDSVISMVHQMRDGTEFITTLQDAMDSLEQELAQFRRDQREIFDAYVIEEKLLERDLHDFLERTETWEQQDAADKLMKKEATAAASPPRRKKAQAASDQHTTHHDPAADDAASADTANTTGDVDLVKRVRVLNAQILQSGGHKGGWDDREHAVFSATLLKNGLSDEVLLANHVAGAVSNQHSSGDVDFESMVAKSLRKCVQSIVTRSENAVRNHLDWYLSHLVLLQEKREAIAAWKARKEAERQQLIQQGLQQVDTEPADAGVEEGDNGDAALAKQKLERQAKAKKARELESWREERERRMKEQQEQAREQKMAQEAREAKRRQELLDKKQQLLLYKLQKEQEAALLHPPSRFAPGSQSPPPSAEELQTRSRRAIEQAKAKRAQLDAMELERQRQQQLPDRPKPSVGAKSPTDSSGSSSPLDATTTLLKPTKAFEARHLTKDALARKAAQRQRQGAHDAYFPGAGVVADAKLKSFGHVPIAPRAVPSWRRNL